MISSFVSADASDRLRIYLNDHRALLAAEHSLAQRSLEANQRSSLGQLLGRVVDQNRADQSVVEQLLDRVGGSANPVKKIAAIVGERFGRLKMNGQLTGYSPLSRVIEVEGLLATTAVRRAMWNAIAALAIDDEVTTDAAVRADTADEQHDLLAAHHVDGVLTAFGETPPMASSS